MENRPRKQLTLVVFHEHPRVLLGMKKRGFGAGRWNGFGGKLHQGESVEQAAMREMQEEAGIVPNELSKVGIIDFELENDPEILEVHIFKGRGFVGEPQESEEMKPQWFNVEEIPFENMWPDDKYWFPLFLADKKFKGRFLFGKDDAVLEMGLSEVEIL